MTHSQRLAQVRECFCRATAADLGADVDSIVIERESLLIRNEFFCGRRLFSESHRGVWFIEEDELKIHRASGELMAVYAGESIDKMLASSETDGQILKLPSVQDPDVDEMPIRRAA